MGDERRAGGGRPAGNWTGGAFRARKFDLNDNVRTTRWFASCKCWKPVDQLWKARFV